mgnify:CR=1 FL=1
MLKLNMMTHTVPIIPIQIDYAKSLVVGEFIYQQQALCKPVLIVYGMVKP